MIGRTLLMLSVVLMVTSCDSVSSMDSVDLRRNPEQVALGKKVYMRFCASCHGAQGQGHSQWRVRDAQGFLRPPPLNGTGHSWHHPLKDLVRMVRDGSPEGKGKMPAWGSTLNQKQIMAVLAYIQSLWPEDTWQRWREINQRKL